VALYEHITACWGEAVAKYAANKHRGGSNGNKGTRYEDFFITTQVVAEAVKLFENPGQPATHIKGQAPGFVDDLRIATDTSTKYFQLKNQENVSWTAGEHPIADDFAYQVTLSKHLGEPNPSTNLVVSSATLKSALAKSIPGAIQEHTDTQHFPWTETANRLLLESPDLRQQVAKLSHSETPTHDAIYGAFCMLQMACNEHPQGATVLELLEKASSFCPGQLRLPPPEKDWGSHIDPNFKQALAFVPGLVYSIKRGFFHWSGFGTSGVFSSSVLSEEFIRFQNDIVQRQPKTFEEFEEVLP
jgi:hypothetical protein